LARVLADGFDLETFRTPPAAMERRFDRPAAMPSGAEAA
jgi:hypothetical protein